MEVTETDPYASSGSVSSADITDATATGRSVLTAKDAASARQAIGAGTQYTLPAATASALGGVKQGAAVADAAGEAPTATEFNALLGALRTSGVLPAS